MLDHRLDILVDIVAGIIKIGLNEYRLSCGCIDAMCICKMSRCIGIQVFDETRRLVDPGICRCRLCRFVAQGMLQPSNCPPHLLLRRSARKTLSAVRFD
jgi:hypothetical protein